MDRSLTSGYRTLLQVARVDFVGAVRAKWFFIYCVIFIGAVVLLFALGVTETQVMGFAGLTRLLITYIQLCVAVVPIMVLISTVRSLVGEKESNVLEYLLSWPIPLGAYYWGKFLSKLLLVILPIGAGLICSVGWALVRGLTIPWAAVGYYLVLLAVLCCCFLGIAMLISSLVKRQEWALGLSMVVWLVLLLFIDVILIGVMLQERVKEAIIVGIALLNPVMTFRTGATILFDPELTSIGPASYVILDHLGHNGFLAFSILYPLMLGLVFAWLGFFNFRRGDLL